MALIDLDEDNWLLEYESCEKLHHDIMELLSQRRRTNSSEEFTILSENILIRLKQYNHEMTELRRKFYKEDILRSFTDEEKDEHSRQIELLRSKYIQMKKLYDNNTGNYDSTEVVGISKFRDDEKGLLEDPERGPDNLSDTIAKQKKNYQTICGKRDLRSDIVNDGMDARIAIETRNSSMIGYKFQVCVSVVLLLLFIGIPTAIFVWKSR